MTTRAMPIDYTYQGQREWREHSQCPDCIVWSPAVLTDPDQPFEGSANLAIPASTPMQLSDNPQTQTFVPLHDEDAPTLTLRHSNADGSETVLDAELVNVHWHAYQENLRLQVSDPNYRGVSKVGDAPRRARQNRIEVHAVFKVPDAAWNALSEEQRAGRSQYYAVASMLKPREKAQESSCLTHMIGHLDNPDTAALQGFALRELFSSTFKAYAYRGSLTTPIPASLECTPVMHVVPEIVYDVTVNLEQFNALRDKLKERAGMGEEAQEALREALRHDPENEALREQRRLMSGNGLGHPNTALVQPIKASDLRVYEMLVTVSEKEPVATRVAA